MNNGLYATVAALALTLAFGGAAAATDLPPSTQKALAKMKVDPKLMDGLDDELKVPQAWLDDAAKEKEVIILGTWPNAQFRTMTEPFRERYPAIKLNYNRSGTAARGLNVVIALRDGRVVADVLTSIADAFLPFMQMKAFADLRELPGIKNVPSEFVAADGTWVSHKLSYRCIGYNTTKVKKSDLPQTWDDLPNNPLWKNGNLAITNHPNSWLLGLWDDKGAAWGENFTRRLFQDVKPQPRKEGMSAATALTVAGEFYANLPAPEWQIQGYIDKGAPIALHCPDPVPITLSQIVMIDKSPRKNAARVFINWMLSREGQVMQYFDSYVVPVHKDLQIPQFDPASESIVGKKKNIRDDTRLLGSDLHKQMLKSWNGYWLGAGGDPSAGGEGSE
ncbi:MAG TPA: extracellular solute-binding protein [Alphaproteobacteria bacterium]|jgi:iron(III) transport system substrate-binding protein